MFNELYAAFSYGIECIGRHLLFLFRELFLAFSQRVLSAPQNPLDRDLISRPFEAVFTSASERTINVLVVSLSRSKWLLRCSLPGSISMGLLVR